MFKKIIAIALILISLGTFAVACSVPEGGEFDDPGTTQQDPAW